MKKKKRMGAFKEAFKSLAATPNEAKDKTIFQHEKVGGIFDSTNKFK